MVGKKLTLLKTEYEWLNEIHSKPLQQSLINLETAYKNFFKKKSGFPKFKKKNSFEEKCRFPIDAFQQIKGNRIFIINKLKDIEFKCSTKDEKYLNKYQNKIKSLTLTKTKSNDYYLSILVENLKQKSLPIKDSIIGIDLGIKDFVITSNNSKFENIKIKRNNKYKLSRLHRKLSKKVKLSKNSEKARIKLAQFYEKLNNKKENYLHQVANELLNENQVIVIESLNVKGMLRNHKLAKTIQELSLSRFKNILKYKANWYGREIIEINRFFPSSKLCSCCKAKNESLTLTDREWFCVNCGTSHDRDLNAAINIKKEGERILKENRDELARIYAFGEEITTTI